MIPVMLQSAYFFQAVLFAMPPALAGGYLILGASFAEERHRHFLNKYRFLRPFTPPDYIGVVACRVGGTIFLIIAALTFWMILSD